MTEDAEIKAQVERLERVRKHPELLEIVPRVAAAGFGVIPLAAGEGWLEVAAAPRASVAALAVLGRLVGREVRRLEVREALIHVYLNRLYPRAQSINFHTFTAADFLERLDEARLLLTEKPHEPEKPIVRPDPTRLVLLDYAYRSYLWNLDGPTEKPSFEAGETDICFEVHGTPPRLRAVVHRDEPLPRSVHILARESYSTVGGEHAHGWRSHEIRRLPFMIHPTELQIVGVASDGSLTLLVYDEVVRVRPGESPRFDVTYHFLSMGQRLKRRLVLRVHGLYTIARRHVACTEDDLSWTPDHLRRWLGADLDDDVEGGGGGRVEPAVARGG